ncbi:hypothetical protein [Pelagicoccus sp. SDUM812002]|uniref:hypothetical protein n=1 Tax=Pelagicoccus sp. SDUM812002 TaxID=3041266 RepID=UPI00281198DB|nr:hypothetical protein [Pelagicoccus sp. SDUM812002]
MKPKPRFNPDTTAQYQMAYVSLLDQLTPGTLDHAIGYLVDSKIGIEPLEDRHDNH